MNFVISRAITSPHVLKDIVSVARWATNLIRALIANITFSLRFKTTVQAIIPAVIRAAAMMIFTARLKIIPVTKKIMIVVRFAVNMGTTLTSAPPKSSVSSARNEVTRHPSAL